MADIVHRIGIQAPASKVYQAVSTAAGVSGWWTRSVAGMSEVGQTLTFSFHDQSGKLMGEFSMQVTALDADRVVKWLVLDGAPEWVGTEISFSISEQNGMTILLFAHRGWAEEVEFTAHCSMKWATFLLSLRSYVENGVGQPAPGDLKIDNWN